MNAQLFGDRELRAAFTTLKVKNGTKVLRRALREGGRPILADAKSRAPVDSGKLRDSIKLRAMRIRKRNRYGVQIRTGTRSELGIPSDARGFYPASQEYGWGEGNSGGSIAAKALSAASGGGRGGPARPYLRPALEGNRPGAMRIIRIWTWKGITDIARAGAITRTGRTR